MAKVNHLIYHERNSGFDELIFEKGSENKKLKVYFHELETLRFILSY